MDLETLMQELDIESAGDFRYFEQFAALMEEEISIDYDTFAELLMMPGSEALEEMTTAFFEDLILGIPDDNTNLYSVIQTIKDTLISLAKHTHERGRGFFADELYRFREWYRMPAIVECQPEDGGKPSMHSACEALMLFREEKLSGKKYNYDFSSAMPQEPDEYTLNIMEEFSQNDFLNADSYTDQYDDSYDEDDRGLDELPIELPREFDPSTYDPEETDLLGPIDPYTDGFVDRYNPVIDGVDYEEYDDIEKFKK